MTPRAPRVMLMASGAERRDLQAALEAAGFHVRRPGEREPFDALVVALDEPESAELLRQQREREPAVRPVAIIPAHDAGAALTALRARAAFALERPVDGAGLVACVRAALSERAAARQAEELEARAGRRAGLIARSPAMARVVEQLERIAPGRGAMLLEGEPGTGKRRVARMVHARSPRRTARFVAMDCGEPQVERALFGDARAEAPATIELAEGGTLYLERVDAAPAALQVRLLRLLHDRAWEPPGGGEARADVRVIAAVDHDPAPDVASGTLRKDLFDRLAVARVRVPPLRERREDLPLLVREILRARPRERGRSSLTLTPGALERLLAYHWPGNVSELEHTVEVMATAASGTLLGVEHLPAHLKPSPAPGLDLRPGTTVAEAERALIAATLQHTGGDKAAAARLLGIGLRTLYRKLGDAGARRR